MASHSLYTSWYTCRFMLTDLLAFLSIGLEERKAKIDATKLGNLIEDIQMRNKFLGFVVPRSEDDLQVSWVGFESGRVSRFFGCVYFLSKSFAPS